MEGEDGKLTWKRRPTLSGIFFPMVSPGHMIPLIDIAKLLSRRGVATTIVTTPGNDPLARPAIDRANSESTTFLPIELILLPFPAPSSAHPAPPADNRENLTNIPPTDYTQLLLAVASLLPSLRDLLFRRRPDFFVSDAVFTWTADVALDLGIPRIVFEGPGAFPLCVHESLSLMSVDDETKPIIVGDLPDLIELTRSELSSIFNYPQMIQAMKDAEAKSFGVVVNTFHGLEPAYVDLFRRRRAGRRAWFIGPVSLSNADDVARSDRGGRSHPGTARLMSWLDEQPVRSVVYVCFGSLCEFDAAQMRETAAGLEAAGYRFVWAVRDWEGMPPPEGWLPEGFEERVEGRGMVVRGWVPQVAILAHAGVGAFVTHCGWNSTLEGVAAGLPLVAWPLMYEQFVNARLITDVLRVGVGLGNRPAGATVMAAVLAAAVRRVMEAGSEEAEEFRRRAVNLAALAREAVGLGGSSYEDVGRMVEELQEESSKKEAAK